MSVCAISLARTKRVLCKLHRYHDQAFVQVENHVQVGLLIPIKHHVEAHIGDLDACQTERLGERRSRFRTGGPKWEEQVERECLQRCEVMKVPVQANPG